MQTVRWLLSAWTCTLAVSLFSPSQYGARAVETLTDILQKFQMSRWSPPPPPPFWTRLVWKGTSVIVDDPLKEEILCLFLTLNYNGEKGDRTFYSSTLVFVIQGTGLVLWSEFSRYGLSVIMVLSLSRQVLLTDYCAFVVLVSVLFFVCFLACIVFAAPIWTSTMFCGCDFLL